MGDTHESSDFMGDTHESSDFMGDPRERFRGLVEVTKYKIREAGYVH